MDTSTPMEEVNPNPVTPPALDSTSPLRNPAKPTQSEISEIGMEVEEIQVPDSFLSPKSQNSSSRRDYKEPPGYFSPYTYFHESSHNHGNKTIPTRNTNFTSDKLPSFSTNQSISMSTTSTMNGIPPLPDDFMEFPDFLVEHFSSVLPPIYKLQALIFETLNSNAYNKFNKILKLGRALKGYIDDAQYQFYLEDIIKLRIVWEFLCVIENDKDSNTHITFSHFLQYKAAHFGMIASHYKEPPPYQQFSKTTPTSSMETAKAPALDKEYNPTPPYMIWSEHNPHNPHFENMQTRSTNSNQVPASSSNAFPQSSLNNGQTNFTGYEDHRNHSSNHSVPNDFGDGRQ